MDDLQKNAGLPEVDRRAFLRAGVLGLAGAALGACTVSVQFGRSSPAQSEKEQRRAEDTEEVARWKYQVKYLIAALFAEAEAWRMSNIVDASAVGLRKRAVGFHSSYSSPLYLLDPIEPLETRFPGWHFALNGLPYFDTTAPCGSARDVNAAEINRLADRSNIVQYGCVLCPISERRAMRDNERASLPRVAAENGVDHRESNVEYVRKYKDRRGQGVWGVGVTRYDHRTGMVTPDLLLTSRDLG